MERAPHLDAGSGRGWWGGGVLSGENPVREKHGILVGILSEEQAESVARIPGAGGGERSPVRAGKQGLWRRRAPVGSCLTWSRVREPIVCEDTRHEESARDACLGAGPWVGPWPLWQGSSSVLRSLAQDKAKGGWGEGRGGAAGGGTVRFGEDASSVRAGGSCPKTLLCLSGFLHKTCGLSRAPTRGGGGGASGSTGRGVAFVPGGGWGPWGFVSAPAFVPALPQPPNPGPAPPLS